MGIGWIGWKRFVARGRGSVESECSILALGSDLGLPFPQALEDGIVLEVWEFSTWFGGLWPKLIRFALFNRLWSGVGTALALKGGVCCITYDRH